MADTQDMPQYRPVIDGLGVTRMLPKSPAIVARIVGEAARPAAASISAPAHDVAPQIAACNTLLHRFVGPIACKLIERALPVVAQADGDVRGYACRLAAEILIPDPGEAFLQAARETLKQAHHARC